MQLTMFTSANSSTLPDQNQLKNKTPKFDLSQNSNSSVLASSCQIDEGSDDDQTDNLDD